MKTSVTRDRILRYLFLGLNIQELLWYFGPRKELTELVYQGKVRLQKDIERPLWQGDRAVDKLQPLVWQDLALTLIPNDEYQIREFCLKLASEQVKRALDDKQVLIFKSIILVSKDLQNQLHEIVRKIHTIEYSIKMIYHNHPKFFLDTLRFFVVSTQEASPDIYAFLEGCNIEPVILDANLITNNFIEPKQKVLQIPKDFNERQKV